VRATLNAAGITNIDYTDTGLSEIVDPWTKTEAFNKSLEIQQSAQPLVCFGSWLTLQIDLLANYDVNGQITAIEDLIAQGVELGIVLRLLCLASIAAQGIKHPKILEPLKREILQASFYSFHLSSRHPLT